jgi:predicted acyltransferase
VSGPAVFLSLSAVVAPGATRFLTVQLDHAGWNGFTFYDLIFPLFIFLAGLSIPFSITKRVERGEDKGAIYRHLAVRIGVLFVIGVLQYGIEFDPFAIRILGVLQRIALCSGAAAVIALNCRVRTQAYITGGILLGYWALMTFLPVPHYGAGVFTPRGNLAGYVDRLLLPYPSKWCCYGLGDNEGILTTIPSIATALLGTLAGHRLRTGGRPKDRMVSLIAAGIACLAVGLAWSLVFPFNKNLWTSSYVLFAGGWSILLLALFHWIIDVKGWAAWSFVFQVAGFNSLIVYLSAGFLRFGFLRHFLRASATLTLAIALLDFGGRWFLAYFLYRKRWFLRV